jgi:hypothetical protein
MARCKLTNMNLRNIRKSREYQCILIDLVSAGVIEQSEAEELLGYTIPPGLLEGDTPGPDPEPEAETPVITTDLPAAKTISGSDTLTIVASVTDGGTLSYVWTKDGDVIPDATAATLTVNEAGTYQCIVTNTLDEDTATASSTACVVSAESEPATVTLLYYATPKGGPMWESDVYTLTEGATFEQESAAIIAAAKTTFEVNDLDAISFVQLNPEYVEGESALIDKYIDLVPQPEAFEDGQSIVVYHQD